MTLAAKLYGLEEPLLITAPWVDPDALVDTTTQTRLWALTCAPEGYVFDRIIVVDGITFAVCGKEGK